MPGRLWLLTRGEINSQGAACLPGRPCREARHESPSGKTTQPRPAHRAQPNTPPSSPTRNSIAARRFLRVGQSLHKSVAAQEHRQKRN